MNMDKSIAQWVEVHGSLETVVNTLIECRRLGLNIYCEFAGHRLYSADVTIDGAYLEVHGVTKEEFESEMNLLRKQTRDEEEKKRGRVTMDQVSNWVEEGQKYIDPKLQKEWKKEVKERAEGISHGQEIPCALELMKKIHNNKIKRVEDLKKFYADNKISGADTYMVDGLLRKFYDEYIEILQNEEREN